ncbi:MAG: NUDIX domain-containing protein [Chloroflexota bacterium]|nr:NUDIX domain-containing protein [Chloroflexota bacterium]
MPQIISGDMVDVYPFAVAEGSVRYLTLLRTPGLPLGNTWQAVHARIHKRETAAQAAARELAVQTGLEPQSLWNIDFVNTFYSPEEDAIFAVPSIGVLVAGTADLTLTTEHVNWEWVTAETAIRRFLWVGQRLAVQTLQDEIAAPMAAGRTPNPYLEIAPEIFASGKRDRR